MLLALISNNIVSSIATALTDDDVQSLAAQYQNVIDITSANPQPQVGWVLNGNTLVDPNASAIPTRKITKLGLRQRFTFPELCAITAASQSTNTAISIPVQVLLSNLSVATYVDLNRPDTIGGMGLLVSVGVITSARANTILTAPISSVEIYRGNE